MSDAAISGSCDPAFDAVREAFAANLTHHNEIGAAVSVTLGGRTVVDLWAGWEDAARTRPWRAETLVPVWSVGKAVTAVCLLRLVEAGKVDLDAPVSRYWPEFAQAGKDRMPVRYLLSHQAGLPAVRKSLPPGATLDWQLMTTALADQEPWWEPGARFGYHTNTQGFLVGEVIRRVDGRGPGHYLREEIAAPMDVDFHIGLAAEHDSRVAEWMNYQPPPDEESMRPWLDRDPATLEGIDLCRYLAYRNPPPAAESIASRAWRGAEFPSTNGHSNARAIARFFGGLANGGVIDGHQLLSPTLIEQARTIQSDGEDVVLGRPNRFGLGFQLTIPGVRPLGPGAHAFGHYGNGGILGFADPDAGLGFGYVCNRAGRSWRDPRNIALVDAVYQSLG